MTANTHEAIRARYDDLPYRSYAYMHSAPEQLAAVAGLFGLAAPEVATARVLELGGAAGGNLIPFALRHPRAQALGIDISGVQVAEGREYIERLGAANVTLSEADFLELDPASLGQFDYIVAHGVYSWVSPEVQQAVLAIVAKCLAPDGVAFVSYNTYPGWKAKEILRDAMLMHAGSRPTAAEQVAYGRSMIGFLQKIALKGGLTATALNENLAQIANSPVSYVAHDYLEPFNLPCYFHEFVERAGSHGLAYLGEAQPSMMMPSNYGQELAEQLYGALGPDQVRVEQYLDFAISRSFRQTLLIHAERAKDLRWQLKRETLHGMHFAASASCVDGAIKLDGQPQEFATSAGNKRISVALSGIKQAIAYLSQAWPGTATREQLIDHAHGSQGTHDNVSRDVLGEAIDELLEIMVLKGMARMRLHPVDLAAPGAGLTIDPLVRRQVAALPPGQHHVVNAWHDTVDIGRLERLLFPMMDGSASRSDLVAAVADALSGSRLTPRDLASGEGDADAVVEAAIESWGRSAVLHR